MRTDASQNAYAVPLLAWFGNGGRHDLPWQHPRTPYRVWLSEVMLQQTQVRTVIPYFERFVAALPDLASLADADPDTVLALWSGLGYYSRARNLHLAAKLCMERHAGALPREVEALAALPGIGRSTAAAIASQAWNDRHAILDGNVRRVLARYHGVEGWPGLPSVERRLWAFAQAHVEDAALPQHHLADYTQAQMDLGATICTRLRPACIVCPLQAHCVARIEGRTGELPTPRPARELPRREAHVLVVRDTDGRVLLRRRPPVGVWATLWSLPQFDDPGELRAWMQRTLRDAGDASPLPAVGHTFSHYHLTLRPLSLHGTLAAGVHEADDPRFVDARTARALGIPAPIRRLLDTLFET